MNLHEAREPRVIAYELLTAVIIALGRVRARLFHEWGTTAGQLEWAVRKDRTFYATTFETFYCCDCGLAHLARPLPGEKPRWPSHRVIPIRPSRYDYRLRLGAKSSAFIDESKAEANAEQARASLGLMGDPE